MFNLLTKSLRKPSLVAILVISVGGGCTFEETPRSASQSAGETEKTLYSNADLMKCLDALELSNEFPLRWQLLYDKSLVQVTTPDGVKTLRDLTFHVLGDLQISAQDLATSDHPMAILLSEQTKRLEMIAFESDLFANIRGSESLQSKGPYIPNAIQVNGKRRADETLSPRGPSLIAVIESNRIHFLTELGVAVVEVKQGVNRYLVETGAGSKDELYIDVKGEDVIHYKISYRSQGPIDFVQQVERIDLGTEEAALNLSVTEDMFSENLNSVLHLSFIDQIIRRIPLTANNINRQLKDLSKTQQESLLSSIEGISEPQDYSRTLNTRFKTALGMCQGISESLDDAVEYAESQINI